MSCTGKHCSKVRYELASVDGPLTYVYTPISSKPSSGDLDPDYHQDYINLWNNAFLAWLGVGILPGTSPFKDTDPECEDGCECDLGAEVVVNKQYTYAPPAFQLKNGKLAISGKFTMRVRTQAGVCTPKAGKTFSMRGGKQDREALAMLPAFNGEPKPRRRNA